MDWYYADGQQQVGPVDDAQLAALASSGKILNDTLVWREGMENWQMYGAINAPGAGAIDAPPTLVAEAPPPAPGEAVCAECGRMFNMQEMIAYGGIHVCAGCKPVFVQKLAEGARLNTGELRYAGFWIRVAAKLLDRLIIGLPFILLVVVLIGTGVFFAPSRTTGQEAALNFIPLFQLVFQFGFLAVQIAYEVFFLGKYGATLGKMACGLRVVGAEGGRVSYGRATGRAFAEILSGMICYIGYIIVGFDQQKRSLHDHICSTRVIYK